MPSQFHGLPVKELAFVDAGKAETLVISDGIEVIDHQAAKANPYLKNTLREGCSIHWLMGICI